MRQEELPIIIMKMLTSFVSDRTAQTRINSRIGDKFQIESGVPQGGILSPIKGGGGAASKVKNRMKR